MSPEHDLNLPTATVESASADTSAETPQGSAGEAVSQSASEQVSVGTASALNAVSATGAAAAVARAPEVRSAENDGPEQAAATSEPVPTSAPAAMAEASSTAEVTEQAASADTSEVTAAIQIDASTAATASPADAAVDASAPGEPTESAETTQTMDQLMEQFAVPEPAAAEGEIFDGHVLAVTDAGVIVDVGGKFEGLVPAQEFVDSGSPIEFGRRTDDRSRTLARAERRLRAVVARARSSPPRLGTHREIVSRARHDQRKGHGAHQGRPGGGYRCALVPAGFAD